MITNLNEWKKNKLNEMATSIDSVEKIIADYLALDFNDEELDLSNITDRVSELSHDDQDKFIDLGVEKGIVDAAEDGWEWINPITKEIFEKKLNESLHIGDTISINDIDYDIMDYFSRTNRKLLVTMNSGEEIKTSVGKFYNDLVFHGKFPSNLDKKDISFVKIIG